MHVARAVSVSFAMSACSVACAQTFARYFLDAINMTDQDRGTGDAAVGDVIRMSLRVEHDSLSYAGGKIEMLYSGVRSGAIAVLEDDSTGFPYDPWEFGREALFRIVASDGPVETRRPHNEDVVAMGDGVGKITDVNDDFFDFASTPPGLGGLAGAFPLADGEAIFVFDYVYEGGVQLWDAGHNGRARLWRDGTDINGIEVPASSGATFVVSPAPSGMGVIGLGLLVAGRRRRSV